MRFSDLDPLVAAWIGLAMLLLWLASLLKNDASIVDVFWGPGFILVAIASAKPWAYGPRKALVMTLVTLWALRLSVHLHLRNRGKGEDARYRAMRERSPRTFPVISLVTVFAFQGAGMWTVSLPIQAAMGSPEPFNITILDVAGAVVLVIGFLFEAVGDLQLTRFKTDPDNAGKIMDRGLWRYTRHPNYFGDCVLWWGFGLIGLATGPRDAWWCLAGPAMMTIILLQISGVALLERHMRQTRPAYAAYVVRTSAFVPRPPKDRAVV